MPEGLDLRQSCGHTDLAIHNSSLTILYTKTDYHHYLSSCNSVSRSDCVRLGLKDMLKVSASPIRAMICSKTRMAVVRSTLESGPLFA